MSALCNVQDAPNNSGRCAEHLLAIRASQSAAVAEASSVSPPEDSACGRQSTASFQPNRDYRERRFEVRQTTINRGNITIEGLCTYKIETQELLFNFALTVKEDIEYDDGAYGRQLRAQLCLLGDVLDLEFSADLLGQPRKLAALLYQRGGSQIEIRGSANDVRDALIEGCQYEPPIKRKRTPDFGWAVNGLSYHTQTGTINADAYLRYSDRPDTQVDLSAEEQAGKLDLKTLPSTELRRVKQHIVDDLLRLHTPAVTWPLLSSVAVAVLFRFVEGMGRPAFWLVGPSGAGKSFAAGLFLNFFGDFPVSAGKYVNWSSTANYIQRQGFAFRDCLYLVDDFKPELTTAKDAVRIIQTYAEESARGRLQSNATSRKALPIRGILLCTGEDVPQHSDSFAGRSILLPVSNQSKDAQRGNRCICQSPLYSAVTADFIRWALATRLTKVFDRRVKVFREYFYKGIAGRPNDLRIAGNLGLVAAGLFAFGDYLADVWPSARQDVKQFIRKELIEMRNRMLEETRIQQAGEIFLTELAELYLNRELRFDPSDLGQARVVGKRYSMGDVIFIATREALKAVQDSLRRQGREPIRVSEQVLLGQLRMKLVDESGNALLVDADATRQTRIGGHARRGFFIRQSTLLGVENNDNSTGVTEATQPTSLEVRREMEPCTSPPLANAQPIAG